MRRIRVMIHSRNIGSVAKKMSAFTMPFDSHYGCVTVYDDDKFVEPWSFTMPLTMVGTYTECCELGTVEIQNKIKLHKCTLYVDSQPEFRIGNMRVRWGMFA